MRTEDLIKALVVDLTVSKMRFQHILLGAITSGAIIATAVFLLRLGVRPDFGHALDSARFLFKFVFALSLIIAAAALLSRLAIPGVSAGFWAWGWLLAPALLVVAVAAELFVTPAESWQPRLVGSNARVCLTLIPLLSIAPLACIMLALRQGAPTRPGLAGAVAGLVASGIAATLYASHCTDDSPLFVATWYSLAIGLVALVGYVVGSRALRW
ncbi:MAG TPA: NrsF family protein [Methylocystis sp.]|nr:NrsF family protein [Methylocystis sp.]